MRCHCCDRALSDTEVIFNKELNEYEPCSTCLDIALDAAYSDGFKGGDEEIYEELGDIDDPEIAILDGAFEQEALQLGFRFEDEAYD